MKKNIWPKVKTSAQTPVSSKVTYIFTGFLILAAASVQLFSLASLKSVRQTLYPTRFKFADMEAGEVLGASTMRGAAPQIFAPELKKGAAADFSQYTAKSFLVYDEDTGRPLAFRSPDAKQSVASLTKLITGLVAYEHLDPSEIVEIESQDEMDVRPVLGFKTGDKIKAGDLLSAMMVGSCNDAALALAHAVERKTGARFTILMNSKAATLGMKDSNFSNPMGFDSDYNYSTAADLEKLVKSTQSLAFFKLLGRKTAFDATTQTGEMLHTVATNKLLARHPEIEAIKTGQTPSAAGAMITRATRNGHSIIVIVLGSQDREGETLKLADEIFSAYVWKAAE